jgi:hypothetical protein
LYTDAMGHFDHHLPVLQTDENVDELPSCSPSVYISNEEEALLTAMRKLREHSAELNRELREAGDDRRSELVAGIESLRAEWKALAQRREDAFVRKMVMLGHLPDSALPPDR